MNWSNNLLLRWAATAAVAVLMIVIVVRWIGRERTSAATSLLDVAPAAGAAVSELRLEPVATAEPAGADEQAAEQLIAVDVIGAVMAPGVYRLQPASRVEDAITAAGGFAPDADRERINLAAQLQDGAQLRVPRAGDVPAAMPDQQAAGPVEAAASGSIDLNAADAATLETLPGIGPATAEAIVAYREANGPFRAVDELQNIKGIGPSLLGKLVGLVTIGE